MKSKTGNSEYLRSKHEVTVPLFFKTIEENAKYFIISSIATIIPSCSANKIHWITTEQTFHLRTLYYFPAP
jgi:hypothetical protein